jgi:TetR/AcrR family transcriptional regulator of autoinduction and epiphytic fitness
VKLSCRTPPTDKREATKWPNRRAIVGAAAQLTAEHGIDGFSVESLAERAGVSRRTIFNHFSSVDEAIFASFASKVDQLYEEVEKALGGEPFATLSEACLAFTAALRSVDILTPVHPSIVLLSAMDQERQRPNAERLRSEEIWMIGLMEGMVRDCVDSLHERMGEAELWEIRLLVEMAIAAMSSSVKQWAETTDQTLSERNRRTWTTLLDRSLTRLETGFARPEP